MTTLAFGQLQRFFYILGTVVLIVLVLYFAQAVLLPVVTAVFFTFILAPLVVYLQKKRVPRVLAVFLVVGLALVVIGLILFFIYLQFQNLVTELPQHRNRILEQVNSIRDWGSSSLSDEAWELVDDVIKTINPKPDQPAGMVIPVQTPPSGALTNMLGPTLDFLVNAGLVVLLVIFILLQRENLRDRMMKLLGYGQLTNAYKTLEDATHKIKQFLTMQLVVNGTYGIALGMGLYIIGVKYALTWAFLAAIFRYIPYIGPWIAAVFPIAMSVAVPGGNAVFYVVGLVVVLELISNNFMEPWLYGRCISVSEVALLISAVFWTWLWGPLGLVLSTPLTAALVVLGRQVPHLEFLGLLLGDEQALDPPTAFYQRLQAKDSNGATEIMEQYRTEHSVAEVYDDIVIASLQSLQKDEERENISPADSKRFVQSLRDILNDVLAPLHEAAWDKENKESPTPDGQAKLLVYGLPAYDEADEIVLEMFKDLMNPGKIEFKVFSMKLTFAEALVRIKEDKPAVVVIGCVRRQQAAHCRFLCKQISRDHATETIGIGAWAWDTPSPELRQRFEKAGASFVSTTFITLRHELEHRYLEKVKAPETVKPISKAARVNPITENGSPESDRKSAATPTRVDTSGQRD